MNFINSCKQSKSLLFVSQSASRSVFRMSISPANTKCTIAPPVTHLRLPLQTTTSACT